MNTHSTFKQIIAMSAMFGFMTAGIATADINIPAGIGLEKNMYFQTPGGDPVQVKAGMYEVAPSDEWLTLTPVGGERYDSVLIDAKEASHDEKGLETARAFLLPASESKPDLQNLLLYLPAGTAYEAIGSQSGVFSRGLGSWAKKIGGAAKGVVKGAGRAAKGVVKGAGRAGKRVVKTGIRAGRLGVKVGLYAPKKVLKTAGKLGRQVYRGGKLLHKTVNGLISLPKTGIKLAVGQACATVIPSTRKACEKAVERALNTVHIPKLP